MLSVAVAVRPRTLRGRSSLVAMRRPVAYARSPGRGARMARLDRMLVGDCSPRSQNAFHGTTVPEKARPSREDTGISHTGGSMSRISLRCVARDGLPGCGGWKRPPESVGRQKCNRFGAKRHTETGRSRIRKGRGGVPGFADAICRSVCTQAALPPGRAEFS